MGKKTVWMIFSVALFVVLIVFATIVPESVASSETRIYVDPSETEVSVGNTFIINVDLADVIDLYGYDIWLSYNTSFLDVISVGPPHLLPEPMIEIIEPDGIVHISKILSPPEPPVSGSGTLAVITFNATALGSYILDLFDTMLVDPYLSPIPHTVIDGSVTVLSTIHGRWAVIEDVNSDGLKVEAASDEVWSILVELYHNRSERWIGGIVEEYDNKWGFRFDPNTIIVEVVVIEVWQTTIRGISENLDYWLGEMACVWAKVVEINPLRVPDDYPTIQEAINAASDGGAILVASGTYYEHVVVNKTVSLIGENKSNTVIDGNGTGIVVEVVADYVNISGFSIQNGDLAGVAVYSGDNTITGDIIKANNVNGVFLNSLIRSNTVANNTIMNNTNGILIESTWDGSYICGNVLINNTNGIVLRESMFLVLRGNKMSSNGYNLVVEPAWLIAPADSYEYFHDIDDSNTVDGKPIYYWINEHDKPIPKDAGYVALINCTRITVENLNLSRNSQGVLLALTTNSTIRNVNVSNNYWCGIALEFSSERNYVIRNSIDRTNEYGILLAWYSGYNKIVNNTITYGGSGISVGSNENEITSNTVLDNKLGILISGGGNVLRYNNITNNIYNFGLKNFIQDIDVSNTVNGKPIYYWANQHDRQVPNDAGYVAIVNSTNIMVKNLNLTNNFEGVLIAYSNNSLIKGVTVFKTKYGIKMYSSHYNTVSNNTFLNSSFGVYLAYSNNNTIVDNKVLNITFGVSIKGSSNNLVGRNAITASYSCVWIFSSQNNRIRQNRISNSSYAISIGESSQNNIIETNVITNNYIGISIYDSWRNTIISNTIMLNTGYGIYLCRAESNVIYHNNFINNTQQAFSHEPNNIFDNGYPSGGNYWSDYTGVDYYSGPYQNETGSDGIGDTPYVILHGEDRYPLMNPWQAIHNIAIVSLSFSKENPTTNETVHIYVTVQNKGNFTETFDVSVYYTRVSDPLIGTQNITLTAGANTTLTFEWTPNMTGRYEILSNTTEIPEDIDPTDNTLTTIVYVYGGGSSRSESFNGSHIAAFLCVLFATVMIIPEFRKNKKRSLVDVPANVLKHNLANNRTNMWHDCIRRQPI